MSKLREDKVGFASPNKEDDAAKIKSLEDWTNDRIKLLSWRPFIGTLAMNLELIPVVDYRCLLRARMEKESTSIHTS